MKRKLVSLSIIISMLLGCSSSSSSNKTSFEQFQEEMKNNKEDWIINQAESCDNGDSPIFISSYTNDAQLCKKYIADRDKILEKREKEKKERSLTQLLIVLTGMLITTLMITSSIWERKKRNKLKQQELEYKKYPYLDPNKSAKDILYELDVFFSEIFLMEGIEKLLFLMYGVICDGNSSYVEGYISEEVKSALIERYHVISQEEKSIKFSNIKITNFSIDKYDYLFDDEEISISVEYTLDQKKWLNKENKFPVQMSSKAVLRLRRPFGMQTPVGKTDFITNCKQCGAPVSPSQDRICIYCGAGLPNHAFTWKVTYCDIQDSE